ncbi:MAG TPA: ATP-binding protein, partial [Coleofasciculaceae cyanobacterium]
LWVSPWQDPDGLDWVIVATLPRSAFMNQIEANRRTTTLLCGLVIVMAVFLGWVMARQLAKPVRSLARAAGQLAAGDLDHRAETFAIHELNDLSIAFNRMADELHTSLTALGSANQSLESRVVARTAALAQALSDLKSAQAQLIQTEKMSGLGQMVAGIAHEINNPVAFIHGNLGVLRQYIDELTGWLALLGLPDRDRVAPEAIAQIREEFDVDEVAFVLSDLPKLIRSMEEGTRRIQEIVNGLRNFSRLDQVDLKPVNLNDGLESTLLILTHRLKRQGDRPEVRIVKHYSSLVPVWCHPGQLNQVFMNLLANAIDALDEAWAQKHQNQNQNQNSTASTPNKPTLPIGPIGLAAEPTITLSTRIIDTAAGPRAEVSISDNGVGIPSEIQNQLFDPFFTTKPVGKGTGLGLAIAYQIVVDRHHGQLTCQSTLGELTTFTLQIPIGQPASDPVERRAAPGSAEDRSSR